MAELSRLQSHLPPLFSSYHCRAPSVCMLDVVVVMPPYAATGIYRSLAENLPLLRGEIRIDWRPTTNQGCWGNHCARKASELNVLSTIYNVYPDSQYIFYMYRGAVPSFGLWACFGLGLGFVIWEYCAVIQSSHFYNVIT